MPEFGYCKDCKWWDEGEPAGDCTLVSHDEAKMYPCPRHYSYYGGDSEVYIETEPDFGCVQFEVKAT